MLLRPLRHPDDVINLEALFNRCEESTGRHPLSEHKYRSLVGAPLFGQGFLVAESDMPVGYVHILESKRPGLYELEMAVDPIVAGQIEDTLIEAALSEIRRVGGEFACLWVYSPIDEEFLHRYGFVQSRSLHEMRTSLPVAPPPIRRELERRAFHSGDEAALLDVNNRAFHGHPETGGWTLADLRSRQEYEWYDEEGIRMAWSGGRLLAFCWTKVHSEYVGEIYLIAADPDVQGRGLGRVVALDGLQYLAEAKGNRTAMLYADGENQAALKMYESIGFVVHQTSRAFTAPVHRSGV